MNSGPKQFKMLPPDIEYLFYVNALHGPPPGQKKQRPAQPKSDQEKASLSLYIYSPRKCLPACLPVCS